MCVLSIKTCLGLGVQWGQPLVPLRAQCQIQGGREGELTPLLLILHSTDGLDFACELDPTPVISIHRLKEGLPQVTLHFLCTGKEFLWMHWPLTGYLPTVLHGGCQWDGFCTCWWPQQCYQKNELSSQWHSKQMCRSHMAIACNLQKFKFSSMLPNVSQV